MCDGSHRLYIRRCRRRRKYTLCVWFVRGNCCLPMWWAPVRCNVAHQIRAGGVYCPYRGQGVWGSWCMVQWPLIFSHENSHNWVIHIICEAYALTYANRIHYVPKALEKITGDMCLRPAGPRYAIKRKDETSKEISHLLHRSCISHCGYTVWRSAQNIRRSP